jgi:hypothetical protein
LKFLAKMGMLTPLISGGSRSLSKPTRLLPGNLPDSCNLYSKSTTFAIYQQNADSQFVTSQATLSNHDPIDIGYFLIFILNIDKLSFLGNHHVVISIHSFQSLKSFTYDHRTLKTKSLVRSAIFFHAEFCFLFPSTVISLLFWSSIPSPTSPHENFNTESLAE